jgi:hypothetical protein
MHSEYKHEMRLAELFSMQRDPSMYGFAESALEVGARQTTLVHHVSTVITNFSCSQII